MCGISGYKGTKYNPTEVVLRGISLLSYRGYDSYGVAYYCNNNISTFKSLSKNISSFQANSSHAIAHTRWSTHGIPSLNNAHPHFSEDQSVAIVHNGIIENYQELKKENITYISETDSEVIAHLFRELLDNYDVRESAFRLLKTLEGAFAIVILYSDYLIGIRKDSPLVFGIESANYYLASDPLAFSEYTANCIYFPNNSFCIINGTYNIFDSNNLEIFPKIEILDIPKVCDKGEYETYMLKEIYESPTVVKQLLERPIDLKILRECNRVILLGCGSSYYSCILGKYFLERYTDKEVSVEYASDFCFHRRKIFDNTVILAVSQSGETFDVLEAVEYCQNQGFPIYCICNVLNSSLIRRSNSYFYLNLGYEIGVCSTKAFLGQIVAFLRFALELGSREYDFSMLPSLLEQIINLDDSIKQMAGKIVSTNNMLYLGRGYGMPLASEGALKMKEISYIHSEAIHSSELKHGNIALIDQDMICIVIAGDSSKEIYQRICSNVSEVQSRKGRIFSILEKKDITLERLSEEYIELHIPECNYKEELFYICATIPLQLLAYHVARLRGCDTDKPRNLAKSCTTS